MKNTAAEKMSFIVNKMLEFRSNEGAKLENDPTLLPGDVTTVNLTKINGGIQSNVVPSEITIMFDCRLAINVDHDAFVQQVRDLVVDMFSSNQNFKRIFYFRSWKIGALKLAAMYKSDLSKKIHAHQPHQ